jgi:hypothetical protein
MESTSELLGKRDSEEKRGCRKARHLVMEMEDASFYRYGSHYNTHEGMSPSYSKISA